MYELLYELSPYTPLVVLLASVLDVFFVSGYVLYGAAMMGSVLIMHTTDMISTPALFLSAYIGTVSGSVLNFWAGRAFSTHPVVARRLAGPNAQKAQRLLQTRGLFWFICIGRFITLTRPLYGLIIGTLNIRFRRFFVYESGIAFVWISFWLYIILRGEDLARTVLSHI
jgi:membrane protein DedA with SNARE-associated domain